MNRSCRIIVLCILISFLGVPSVYAQTQGEATVDIVVEGMTTKPFWYDGRAEPTPGNSVRLVAVASGLKSASLGYHWVVDGRPLDPEPVASKSSVVINTGDELEHMIQITVFDQKGTPLGSNIELVTFSKPQVALYEDNLLRGMSRNAVGESLILDADEVTVRAIPYFMNPAIMDQGEAIRWLINEKPITATLDDPFMITVQKGEGGGSSRIGMILQNRFWLTERGSHTFTLHY